MLGNIDCINEILFTLPHAVEFSDGNIQLVTDGQTNHRFPHIHQTDSALSDTLG